jgi:hypothetical protein
VKGGGEKIAVGDVIVQPTGDVRGEGGFFFHVYRFILFILYILFYLFNLLRI